MAENQGTAHKVRTVLLWLVTLAVALPMMLAGGTKFLPGGMWPELFTGWSYSIPFLYLIGVLEVGGAIALLVPRFATYAATLLAAIMIGAVYTLVANPGEMGVTPPTVNVVLLTIIAFARREQRWRPS